MNSIPLKRIGVVLVVVAMLGISGIPITALRMDNSVTLPSTDGNILYVGGSEPGNYTRIQDAIDNASSGDTVFVYDDSSPYYENVMVNTSITLIGEDKNTTVIDAHYDGDALRISADGVNVSGFTLFNSSSAHNGMVLVNASHCVIEENMIVGNVLGILIKENSSHNIISRNVISSSRWQPIGLIISLSNNNVVSWNVIKDVELGIELSKSVHNEIYRNNITQCDAGLYLYHSFSNNISQNNFIKNGIDARWVTVLSSYPKVGFNTWTGNYWRRPRVLPKPIVGFILGLIPWVTFDWHPATEPYEI